ncbi:hypothetical protein [Treponema phagedenis]|nr:hypothetical protein [Treponema phagedenis]
MRDKISVCYETAESVQVIMLLFPPFTGAIKNFQAANGLPAQF